MTPLDPTVLIAMSIGLVCGLGLGACWGLHAGQRLTRRHFQRVQSERERAMRLRDGLAVMRGGRAS